MSSCSSTTDNNSKFFFHPNSFFYPLFNVFRSPLTVHHLPFINIMLIFKLGIAVQNLCCRFGGSLCLGTCSCICL